MEQARIGQAVGMTLACRLCEAAMFGVLLLRLWDLRSHCAVVSKWPVLTARQHALRGRLCFNVQRVPSVPLSDVAFELAASMFGVRIEDVGAALGTPRVIKAALAAAGFADIKACSWKRPSLIMHHGNHLYTSSVVHNAALYPATLNNGLE